jgi:shikimate kinase
MCAESKTGRSLQIVALTGFMGAGKSSVGHALAVLLGWAFVDLDHEIEARQQRRIRDLFQTQGEPRFREIEAETLRTVLAQLALPTVLALGGGTFIQQANIELLRERGAQVVFLKAPMELLLQRCRLAAQPSAENLRPLAANPDAFRALYAQRLAHYRCADLTLDTRDMSFEQQAAAIVAGLRLAAGAR